MKGLLYERGQDMEILLVLVTALACYLCFTAGAKIGQAVSKGEEIKLPAPPNPLEAIREHKDKKKADEEAERLNTILHNIDNYDGTSRGQKDVP